MSDVTVHIDETLNESSMRALEEDISHFGGVQQIAYTQQHPHLMVVRYDHNQLSSNAILSAFNDHGLHAELIGF